MGKKISPIVLILISMVANSAYAAVFECTTKQALRWEEGALESNVVYAKTILRLDDETGELWMAAAGHLGGVAKGTIELPMGAQNDLIFTQRTTSMNPEGEEVATRRFILHIRGWKLNPKTLQFSHSDLNFIAYEDSPPIVLTGGCVQSEGKAMPKDGVIP
ncbi:hypothetical protein [Acidicapsa acidisoli]|uniref:hypothetical protein n=1 Tax=Acidicapsa acidisoli TaxID=1615681 RepID=UPI0021DFA05D|nr:hypothetical protein [Acidicapsa acidisoli]